jgi:hypothetical protein
VSERGSEECESHQIVREEEEIELVKACGEGAETFYRPVSTLLLSGC